MNALSLDEAGTGVKVFDLCCHFLVSKVFVLYLYFEFGDISVYICIDIFALFCHKYFHLYLIYVKSAFDLTLLSSPSSAFLVNLQKKGTGKTTVE